VENGCFPGIARRKNGFHEQSAFFTDLDKRIISFPPEKAKRYAGQPSARAEVQGCGIRRDFRPGNERRQMETVDREGVEHFLSRSYAHKVHGLVPLHEQGKV
jgi:hypothetical protein